MFLKLDRSLLLRPSILFFSLTGLVMAFSTGPPPQRTGGFGEPTCIDCHTGAPLNSPGGSLTIDGVPVNYIPNTNYQIMVRLRHTTQRRWGFELAARSQNGGAQAGTLTVNADGTQRIQDASNVQYISHSAAGTFPGTTTGHDWTFTWTAPPAGRGTVQFNAAGNAANNNGEPSGDFIYTAQATSMEAPSGPLPCTGANNTFFAQFANGGGISSKLILTNPGTAAVTGCFEAKNNDGAVVNFNVTSEPAGLSPNNFTIPPGGAVRFTTDSLGDLVAGSVRVATSTAIGGVVLYVVPGLGSTGVGSSPPVSGFITPVERNAGTGLDTGLAFVNTGGSAVTVNLTLNRPDGSAAGTAAVNLAPGGHAARFITELFGGAVGANFIGTVVARVSSGNVGGTALRIGGEFTTLPVTPLP